MSFGGFGLSYVGIALLTALSLGLVLLTTLRTYYRQQELDYLSNNARAIGSSVGVLLEAGPGPEVLASQVKALAFLSQTRVRVLGSQEEVLADSGDPRELGQAVAVSLGLETGGFSQAVTQTVEASGQEQRYTSVLSIDDLDPESGGERVHVEERLVVVGGDRESLGDEQGLVALIPGVGPQPGLPGARMDERRSGEVVREPLYDLFGDLKGYVELSEAPAIGREILNSVAWVWAMSGGVAVLVAAAVGWFVSRRLSAPLLALTDATTRMAGGDLSTRAEVGRQDELGQLATSFNEMAGRVEHTVLALRRFVADAAHQFHTPLTALRTNLELLATPGSGGERRILVERAQAQVARLETLSGGLLDLSRIEAGADDEERSAVDLVMLAQEVGEIYASRADQAGISFDIDSPVGPLTIEGNDGQLRQALGNLLDNGLKFTPEGGNLTLTLRNEGDRAILGVEDTGPGVPDEDIPNLFARFHRGRNAAGYPGSGLGLAIVKAIVDGHGGQVTVQNTAAGARFSVGLPLS